MKSVLEELMRMHTKVRKDGFSIFINEETARWNECIDALGKDEAYGLMAKMLNHLYSEQFAEEYIFSDDCMAYEIAYHANAYFKLMGFKGYSRHPFTYLLKKGVVVEHCEVIDISTYDLRSRIQKTVFDYKNGIRDCYKGTKRDPFRKHD